MRRFLHLVVLLFVALATVSGISADEFGWVVPNPVVVSMSQEVPYGQIEVSFRRSGNAVAFYSLSYSEWQEERTSRAIYTDDSGIPSVRSILYPTWDPAKGKEVGGEIEEVRRDDFAPTHYIRRPYVSVGWDGVEPFEKWLKRVSISSSMDEAFVLGKLVQRVDAFILIFDKHRRLEVASVWHKRIVGVELGLNTFLVENLLDAQHFLDLVAQRRFIFKQ